MINTVLMSGKGMWAFLTLMEFQRHFPEATLTRPKLKWWQFEERHELRLQNLSNAEIRELHNINNRPLVTHIKIEVF